MRLALAALLLSAAGFCAAQEFGQNHVVLEDFRWRMRATEHFDIYYYEGSESLVPAAAEILESAFTRVTTALDIPTEAPAWASEKAKKRGRWQRRPFFLYASPNDFQQSNIAQVGDGTGGVTEPFKDRFMVYNDGTRQWLDEVITHEFTHVMQFHVLISGFWKSGRILKTIVYPLWMMEGMAGYTTHGIESTLEEVTIRDAATSGGLIPLVKLEHFGHLKPHQVTLAYKEGAAALAFLASQYGSRKVGDMLRLFDSRLETSQVLGDLIGIDAFEFDRRFREYAETRYRHEARSRRMREPDAFGGAVTRTPDAIPQFNTSPVFSPDLKTMYYLSTSHGHPSELRELDMRTGRSRRAAGLPWSRVENIPLGNFANLSRVLDISRDGRTLAFAGTRNHADALYLYDIGRRRLERRPLGGFMQVSGPRFSPDGRAVVFSGMRRGVTDLYLYDLATRRVTQLTDDPRDDAMPAFTPDGRSIVFSAEMRDAVDPTGSGRRLFRLDLADRSQTRLEDTGAEARDPVVSPDGRRVLFVRDGDGASEVCELDLATGQALLLTRTIGGSFAPAYAGEEIAFSSLRRGNVHIHKGPRSDFLSEPLPPQPRRPAGDVAFTLPGMGGLRPSTATVALSEERPYQARYSTDLFLPAFFYSSAGGFFWTSYWQGSDLLGNHVNNALVNFHSGKSYDYATRYAYSRYRPQLIFGADGSARQDLLNFDDGHTINDSFHTQFAAVSYPFDRYHRAEAVLRSATERYDDVTAQDVGVREARVGALALVRDTVRGRYLVATQGNRARLAYTQAAAVLGGNRLYHTASVEAHQFVQTGSQQALAFRALGVQSLGRDHPNFILGGLGGARGYGRSTTEDNGRTLALATAEYRFPIVPDLNYYMWYFFPDFYFKSVFGTVFTDAGYAWNTRAEIDAARLRSVRHSVGLGLRIYTFILQEFPLILSFDYAHRTTQNGGIFYFYLGQLF